MPPASRARRPQAARVVRRGARGPRSRPRVARDRRPRRLRLRHRGRDPHAPLPRLVRARDPAAAAALDAGLGLRRVRDGGRRHRGNLDAGLPRRRPIPTGSAALCAVPPRALPDLAARDRAASAVERSLCLVRDRSLTIVALRQPRRRPRSRCGCGRCSPSAARTASRARRATGTRATEARGEVSLGAARCRTCPGSTCAASSRRRASDPVWYRALPLRRGDGARLRRRGGPLEPARVGVDAAAGRARLRPLLARRGGRRPRPLPRTRSAGAARPSRARRTRSSTSSPGAPRTSWSRPIHRRATILAGFPWLADWGRQTMIAAPGLAQATGTRSARSRAS